jgi:hypothetical protein
LGRHYRRLKKYYRAAGELNLIGHFHYGLMEVQRHEKDVLEANRGTSWLIRKLKKWLSWEAAFRWSSGYAEDYTWAGIVLIMLLLIFAGGYWWLGAPVHDKSGPWWNEAIDAVLNSFDAATLGHAGRPQQSDRFAVHWLRVMESILVPVQFGFFAFALRNRFRR